MKELGRLVIFKLSLCSMRSSFSSNGVIMKLFALIWTVLFLLAVIPVMRYDRRLRVRKIYAKLIVSFQKLQYSFLNIGIAVKKASISMEEYKNIVLDLKKENT